MSKFRSIAQFKKTAPKRKKKDSKTITTNKIRSGKAKDLFYKFLKETK